MEYLASFARDCSGALASKEAKVRTNENLARVAAFTHYQHRRVRPAEYGHAFGLAAAETEIVGNTERADCGIHASGHRRPGSHTCG